MVDKTMFQQSELETFCLLAPAVHQKKTISEMTNETMVN